MMDWLAHWAAVYYDPSVLSWRMVPGYLGSALIVASFLVRTMIPLRALSAASNACIIVYACFDAQYLTLALNTALLPLNILRLVQMMKLVRRVRSAAHGDRTMDWIKRYMVRRRCNPGQFLFHKGDVADTMFYIVSGAFVSPSWASRNCQASSLASSVCWHPTVAARSRWNASTRPMCW